MNTCEEPYSRAAPSSSSRVGCKGTMERVATHRLIDQPRDQEVIEIL